VAGTAGVEVLVVAAAVAVCGIGAPTDASELGLA
jgi:hypothetical protein